MLVVPSGFGDEVVDAVDELEGIIEVGLVLSEQVGTLCEIVELWLLMESEFAGPELAIRCKFIVGSGEFSWEFEGFESFSCLGLSPISTDQLLGSHPCGERKTRIMTIRLIGI